GTRIRARRRKMSNDKPKTLGDLCTPKPPKKRTCSEHGEYMAKWMIGDAYGRCPVCRKREQEIADRREQKERKLELQAIRRRLMERSGIGPRFAGASFRTYRTDTPEQVHNLRVVSEAVHAVLKRVDRPLVLSGRAGTGKTHLAVSAVRQVIAHGAPAVYCTMTELCREARFGWRDGVTAGDIRQKYYTPRLLVVDEMNELIKDPQN